MRLFIAVNLAEDIREKIAEVSRELAESSRRARADIKWVKPEQFHFTLKFLGECPEEQLPLITEALQQAVLGISPFSIRLGGLGSFPERGAIRIIWVGLVEGSAELVDLASRIESACERLGFPREDRPFSSHLTLGRVKSSKNVDKMRPILESRKADLVAQQRVDSVDLVRSILSPAGPTYTNLSSFPLQ